MSPFKILTLLLCFYHLNCGDGKLLIKKTKGIHRVQVPVQLKGDQIKCKDEQGNFLDWFVAYKLAKISKSQDANVRKGIGYSFVLPGDKEWILSTKNINDSLSVVGRSIEKIYKNNDNEDFIYLAYNDQPPNGPTVSGNGHTKGVILANELGGLWLQHSVPRFPEIPATNYSYPDSGIHNGQIFFCMTLTVKQLDDIVGNVLQITKPNLFKYQFPSNFDSLYPNLKQVVPKSKKSNKWRSTYETKGAKKNQTTSGIFNLPVGGLNLTIFAKGPKFDTEIYSDWVAPTLRTNLMVQSWLNGPHPLPSNCTSKTLSVMNVESKRVDGNLFSTHSDHSKWALGGNKKWTCISDLNRMDHQKVRGGAALCTMNENLWTSFQNSIVDLMPCGKPDDNNKIKKYKY